jgi:hypothetical protein
MKVVDLSMMSKIELGNDVIQEWSRLNLEINNLKDNYIPFVSEVEDFNSLMNKPNNYEPQFQKIEQSGNLFITSFLKNLKNINMLVKPETSLRFWMRCVTLLTFPWERCYASWS